MTPDQKVSIGLQEVSEAVERMLSALSGVPRCPFVLIAHPVATAQYVANIKREDGINIIRNLLIRWNAPLSVPDLPEHEKEQIISALLLVAKGHQEIIDDLMAALVYETKETDHPFIPSKSLFWPLFEKSVQTLRMIEARRAFAREVAEKGPQEMSAPGKAH